MNVASESEWDVEDAENTLQPKSCISSSSCIWKKGGATKINSFIERSAFSPSASLKSTQKETANISGSFAENI